MNYKRSYKYRQRWEKIWKDLIWHRWQKRFKRKRKKADKIGMRNYSRLDPDDDLPF